MGEDDESEKSGGKAQAKLMAKLQKMMRSGGNDDDGALGPTAWHGNVCVNRMRL